VGGRDAVRPIASSNGTDNAGYTQERREAGMSITLISFVTIHR